MERKERIKQLRSKFASLSDAEKSALQSRGIIATVEGRTLSLHNTLLVYLQCNGQSPSVVGGYNQWKRAGRQVQKGQHGYTIWFPVGDKDKETGDILQAKQYFTATVFDIGQTELAGDKPVASRPKATAQEGAVPGQQQEIKPALASDNTMKEWAVI